MDAELKTKWVEALRSGEFKQGTGKLHDPKEDSYCCLGVLCKISGAEWREHQMMRETDDGYETRELDHVPMLGERLLSSSDDEELAKDFANELGLEEHQGVLIGMNDGERKVTDPLHKPQRSFPDIADYIEANL